MNYLIVTNDFLPRTGGVSVFNQGIAEGLVLAGHRVLVLTPDLPGRDDEKLPFKVIRYKTTKYFSSFWPNLLTIYLCLTKRIDVILYGHAVSTLSAGGVIARKLHLARLAVLTHGNDLDYAITNKTDEYFLEYLIKNADTVLANSGYTKDKIITRYQIIESKLKILNPGVWPERIRQATSSKGESANKGIRIITIARLVQEKGIEDLINAFALVVTKYPYSLLVIVGDGREKEKLVHLVHQKKLEENIIFKGFIQATQIYTEIMQCSIFALPSRVETFGITYLEANACGKAVIGTRQGGVPDAVIDGVTGILVEPGDVKQLNKAMLLLIEDEALRNKLGQTGKMRVDGEFCWTKVIQRLEAYMSEAL